MNLHTLPIMTTTKKKRLGLGHGSGRAKTAGRGTKGQKARRKVPAYRYSGGSLAFVKRLPMLRGKLRNKGWKRKPVTVTIEKLNILPKNTVVDIKTLVAHRLVSEKDAAIYGVKILGNGELAIPLNVQVSTSKHAADTITQVGGTVQIKNE